MSPVGYWHWDNPPIIFRYPLFCLYSFEWGWVFCSIQLCYVFKYLSPWSRYWSVPYFGIGFFHSAKFMGESFKLLCVSKVYFFLLLNDIYSMIWMYHCVFSHSSVLKDICPSPSFGYYAKCQKVFLFCIEFFYNYIMFRKHTLYEFIFFLMCWDLFYNLGHGCLKKCIFYCCWLEWYKW